MLLSSKPSTPHPPPPGPAPILSQTLSAPAYATPLSPEATPPPRPHPIHQSIWSCSSCFQPSLHPEPAPGLTFPGLPTSLPRPMPASTFPVLMGEREGPFQRPPLGWGRGGARDTGSRSISLSSCRLRGACPLSERGPSPPLHARAGAPQCPRTTLRACRPAGPAPRRWCLWSPEHPTRQLPRPFGV